MSYVETRPRFPAATRFPAGKKHVFLSRSACPLRGSELVVLVFEQDVGCMISDLYLGASRRTRPLPRGVAGHVAYPIRSIQISDL